MYLPAKHSVMTQNSELKKGADKLQDSDDAQPA